MNMKVISFYNIKGGVAKTTSSLAFAMILHNEFGKRVLLIDIDKQANSSKSLGCYDKYSLSSADLLTAKDNIVKDVIRHSEYGIDVIPANFNLVRANKEVLLDNMRPQQFRLKKQLSAISNDYDYCIIDHPIEENMAVINALAITDDVLIPIRFDSYALDGMEYVLETIDEMKAFNDNLELKGCFLTMYTRSRLYKDGSDYLDSTLNLKFLKTAIRQTIKVSESTFDKPLMLYSPKSTAATDYRKLVEEYLNLS